MSAAVPAPCRRTPVEVSNEVESLAPIRRIHALAVRRVEPCRLPDRTVTLEVAGSSAANVAASGQPSFRRRLTIGYGW